MLSQSPIECTSQRLAAKGWVTPAQTGDTDTPAATPTPTHRVSHVFGTLVA